MSARQGGDPILGHACSGGTAEGSSREQQMTGLRGMIRRRPGMFVGELGATGATNLVLQQVVEPALGLGAGCAEVELGPGLAVTVRHDGPLPHPEQLYQLSFDGGWGCIGILPALSHEARVRVVGDPAGPEVEAGLDQEILVATTFDVARLTARMQELAWLHPRATIRLRTPSHEQLWHSPGGLLDCVEALAEGMGPSLTDPLPLHHHDEASGIVVEIALRRATQWPARVLSFVNRERTRGGGSHEQALRDALADDRGCLPDGLAAVITVEVDEPSYAGATKDRLDDAAVARVVAEAARGLTS
ncbi:MAG: hypothetical protein Q4D89_08345 [Arachnia propionica]|uniref:hypothetical protein n=1 Tax=Arachnia propionica TaxID=1750 RepID=UPI00270AE99E|nr:hypothetical protein [Arachnia propionica]